MILAPGTLAAKFDRMTDMMKNVHDSNGSVVSSKEDKQEGKYGETDNRTVILYGVL